MNWYLKVLKQYADFNGRARRKEFWMFALINMLIIIAFYVLMGLGSALNASFITVIFSVLMWIYSVAVLVPGIAVTVRRLHDIGKEWVYILVVLIPLVGGIWLLIMMAREGVPGENQFGPNPKEVEGEA